MKKITKAASIALYVLLLLGVIFTALMFLGGNIEGEANDTPVYTDAILRFTYFIIALGVGAIIVFEIINLIMHPANAKRSGISIGIMVAVVALAYSLSDGTPLKILGYEGTDNVPSMLLVTDTGLYTFYILLGVLVLSIVGSEVSRLFK
jgi:hypothetical protein